jgi:hypothetical protein
VRSTLDETELCPAELRSNPRNRLRHLACIRKIVPCNFPGITSGFDVLRRAMEVAADLPGSQAWAGECYL